MSSGSSRQRVYRAELQSVQSRIEDWRTSRPQRGPMPAALWKEAAQQARIHGINAVARALRLAYYDLKKRVVTAAVSAKPASRPSFVEVSVSSPPEGADALVEVERPDGARLRVRVLSQEAVIALAEAFLRARV